MKVKEFLNLIDLESLNNQGITIIIPLKEKYEDACDIKKLGDAELSENEKVVFDCAEYSFEDYELYDAYGIEPCFKSENEEADDYEIIDVRETEDYYHYVYNDDGEVWVVIN